MLPIHLRNMLGIDLDGCLNEAASARAMENSHLKNIIAFYQG